MEMETNIYWTKMNNEDIQIEREIARLERKLAYMQTKATRHETKETHYKRDEETGKLVLVEKFKFKNY